MLAAAGAAGHLALCNWAVYRCKSQVHSSATKTRNGCPSGSAKTDSGSSASSDRSKRTPAPRASTRSWAALKFRQVTDHQV